MIEGALYALGGLLLLDFTVARLRLRRRPVVSGFPALERLLPQGGPAGFPDGSESVRRRPPAPSRVPLLGEPGTTLVFTPRPRVDRQARVVELHADILANVDGLSVGQGRAIKRILEDYTDTLIPDQEGA